MINVRNAVYKSLLSSEKENKFSNIELTAAIERYQMDKHEKAQFTALFYGVIEKSITIDYLIEKYTSKKISRLDLSVLIILRLGIFEILYFSTPDSAAVNEAVKLASRFASRAKGFINAVLRKICTDKDALPFPTKNDGIVYYSVKYSLPIWICKSFINDYPDIAEELMSHSSTVRKTTLCANTLRITAQELKNQVNGELGKYADTTVITDMPVSQIEALKRGEAFVQDEASQIQTKALSAQSGMSVIDVCACPGGKSFGAAVSMKNTGSVTSFDIHSSKLPLIDKGAERLGISIIRTEQHDSTMVKDDFINKFDRVICDVPCSGLGVLSKKADLRHRDENLNEELPALQYKILSSSAKYLKQGGILIYSTCTLRKVENEDIVTLFVKNNPDFVLEDFEITDDLRSKDGMLTLFPNVHQTDGFFIAKIKRISKTTQM